MGGSVCSGSPIPAEMRMSCLSGPMPSSAELEVPTSVRALWGSGGEEERFDSADKKEHVAQNPLFCGQFYLAFTL